MTGIRVPSLFFLLVAITSACLITNCPRGGKKRSGARPAIEGSTTEERPFCTLCGPPEKKGICFGPAVCCSLSEGCQWGGPYVRECVATRAVPPTCRMPPQGLLADSPLPTICGIGVCAQNGLCCSAGWCRTDERCQPSSTEDSTAVNVIADRNSQSVRQRGAKPELQNFDDEWRPSENGLPSQR